MKGDACTCRVMTRLWHVPMANALPVLPAKSERSCRDLAPAPKRRAHDKDIDRRTRRTGGDKGADGRTGGRADGDQRTATSGRADGSEQITPTFHTDMNEACQVSQPGLVFPLTTRVLRSSRVRGIPQRSEDMPRKLLTKQRLAILNYGRCRP